MNPINILAILESFIIPQHIYKVADITCFLFLVLLWWCECILFFLFVCFNSLYSHRGTIVKNLACTSLTNWMLLMWILLEKNHFCCWHFLKLEWLKRLVIWLLNIVEICKKKKDNYIKFNNLVLLVFGCCQIFHFFLGLQIIIISLLCILALDMYIDRLYTIYIVFNYVFVASRLLPLK